MSFTTTVLLKAFIKALRFYLLIFIKGLDRKMYEHFISSTDMNILLTLKLSLLLCFLIKKLKVVKKCFIPYTVPNTIISR